MTFKEDVVLIKISKNVLRDYKFIWPYNRTSSTPKRAFLEGAKIIPLYPCLKTLMKYGFAPLKPALYGIEKNICFLDISDINMRIKCDWCSICNGIFETAKENIIKNPKLIRQIDFEKLKKMDKFLDFVLIQRTCKITNEEIEAWCAKTFSRVTINLLLLSQIYLKLEQIELRWCPFKRSTMFYYRNKDPRFLAPSDRNIYEVGKILSKYETITCNNCPRVINDNWKYTRSNESSIFQPLLDYINGELGAPHTPLACFRLAPK
jgi:hypothetical protein